MILNPLISQLCFCKKPHILLYWYSIQPIVPNWRKQQQTNGRPKNTDVPMGMTDLKRVVLVKGISRFFQEVFWLVGIFTPKIGRRWSHFDDHNFSKGVGSTTKYIVFWFVSSLMEIHPLANLFFDRSGYISMREYVWASWGRLCVGCFCWSVPGSLKLTEHSPCKQAIPRKGNYCWWKKSQTTT